MAAAMNGAVCVNVYKCLRGSCTVHHLLMMGAAECFETSAQFCRTTWRHILGDSSLHVWLFDVCVWVVFKNCLPSQHVALFYCSICMCVYLVLFFSPTVCTYFFLLFDNHVNNLNMFGMSISYLLHD